MAAFPEVLEFERTDSSRIVERMEAIAARGDGAGWINLGPALTDDEYSMLPQRSGLNAWFSGRGPAVPMATWTPVAAGGRRRPAQVGVSHGTGPAALARLEDAGLGLPPGWTKKQDHAKHGIVIEVPDTVDYDTMIEWLIRAMVNLSPAMAPGDRWIAEVHDRAGSPDGPS